MSHCTTHITQLLKAAATLLLLLLCVCSAVARDTTRVFSNLRWDNNGNLAQQTVYSVANNTTTYQTMRMLFWDEDDRLNLVVGDGYLSYYTYGHDGNRAIKMTGNASIDQTGTLLNSTNLENITIYPNEYLTVTQAEYTKYYYAGGNRIASKIGTGGFGKMQRLCTEDLIISGNANTLFSSVLLQVTNAASQPTDEYPVDVCAGYNVSNELLHSPLPDFYISQTNLNFTQSNLLQQFRQNLAGGTEAVYYFHSDHLGSASWITNGTGTAVQHLQYLPFGEPFVNEQSTGYFERFTFTGKERDAETGYYYHGARFNSSDLGWLSVDPMADKYPSLSPYAYCAWNPVKLVDPDGKEISTHTDEYGNVVMVYNDGDNGVYRHNGDREFTERELKSQYGSSNTSAGGEYMGKTKYWDEFMNHDNNTGAATKPAGKIHYGESWEPVVVSYNELSMKLGLEATAIGSLPKGIFDIKSHKKIAPDGAMTGKLLEGYYTSARSAGNFLAGLNGATARGMFGQHISYDTYISLAGLLHMQDNKTSRQNEYKGEIPYSGRRIKEGFELGVKIREGRL